MSDDEDLVIARQLAALPDGGFYLVPRAEIAAHCKRLLLNMGRPAASIKFVTRDLTIDGIFGTRVRVWDVHPRYWDLAQPNARRAADALWMASGGGPVSDQPAT